MTFRILFVCAANICRSPTAAKIFTAQLPDSLAQGVVVESAGVAADMGKPWCSSAQTWVSKHKVPVDMSSEHSSRRLTAGRISRAQLILAADAEVKSLVLRADLQARAKLFTMLEAAMLAGGVEAALVGARNGHATSNGLELEALPRRSGEPRLSWLVSEMDAARGLVVPTGRGRRLGSTDILDPHSGRRGPSHRTALRTLSAAVTSLSSSMRDVSSE